MASAVDLLVSVSELDKVTAQARVVDVRWKLGDPASGRLMFLQGHIPGAVYVDMDQDLAAEPGLGGRHPLPDAEHFAEVMRRAGVDNDTWVIAYDDGGSGAPRLWWLLRHYGHTRVSILDGGYAAWLAAGSVPEVGDASVVERGSFTPAPRDGDVMDVEALQPALEDGAIHLLDARAPERWRGDVEAVDRIPGRIPGSINAPSGDQYQDGFFRTPEELRDYYMAFGVADGKPIVVSCGSGVSACVDLVGMELAGIRGGVLCPARFRGGSLTICPSRPGQVQKPHRRSSRGPRDTLLRRDLHLHVRELALFVDHEMAAHVALLFAPHAVRLGNLVALVDQQREGQAELVLERLVRRLIVRAYAEDDAVVGLEAGVVIAQATSLARAARRVVLGIEEEHHAFAALVAELDVCALSETRSNSGAASPTLSFVSATVGVLSYFN